MKTILPLFPQHTITVELFEAVQNAPEILRELKAGNQRYDYCFLDCRRICSVNQVLCATMRALRDQRDGNMRTKTLYSEIVYSMSPNQNITEALKYFGVAEESKHILYLAIDKEIDASLIDGRKSDEIDESLRRICEYDGMKNVYKVSDEVVSVDEILLQIISAIAIRGHL